MKSLRVLLAAAALVALAGCMQVQTQVDAYSVIPADITPKTVYIAPYKGMDASSLAWQTNAATLAGVLAEKGFTRVASRKQARLVAFFGFAVDKGQRVTTEYLIPQWGYVGVGPGWYGPGWGGPGFYGGGFYGGGWYGPGPYYGAWGPQFGVVGYTPAVRTETIYTRSASLDMIDTKTGQKVFQSRAVSRGPCGLFAPVAQPMVRAVLSNFPQGRTGVVTLPQTDQC
ncbi:DUF4136 domain-containing protein [Amorphus orientalis]|uniref:DUF4136 domain-containing protein n=1 Tax=Amorphus orientalis TaxID=649198 RepID=A0AAE4AVS0_9HYPH|nr:DUF4136 domain-containing protein [Amorphus orientalis]MDQ0316964.1 hypothetical protein [Amorphus orientalis]